MSVLDRAALDELVEQMRDTWSGRTTYTDDDEWLDNVEAIIGEVVNACGLETIKTNTAARVNDSEYQTGE